MEINFELAINQPFFMGDMAISHVFDAADNKKNYPNVPETTNSRPFFVQGIPLSHWPAGPIFSTLRLNDFFTNPRLLLFSSSRKRLVDQWPQKQARDSGAEDGLRASESVDAI